MTTWIFIGSAVGILMGLTGAGGGVLAVPLFIFLTGVDIQTATFYSLYCLVTSALFTWWVQRDFTYYRTGVILCIFSSLSSVFFSRLKQTTPSLWIELLFILVCSYSLYSSWAAKKRKKDISSQAQHSGPIVALTGTAVGALATMTGLGGGVILVPTLQNRFHFSQKQAVATSLFTIILTSFSSIVAQIYLGKKTLDPLFLLVLVGTSLISALLIKKLVKHLPLEKEIKLRNWAFTGIILFAISSLIVRKFLS